MTKELNNINFNFNADRLIKVKDLDLYYESFQALKKVNIDINKNTVTAFIGPSGCGKSTLLKTFNRMNDLVPNCKIEGEIEIADVNIYNKNVNVSYLRKNAGMVFQKSNLFAMSVYDNIAYGPRTFGVKKKSQLDEIVEYSLTKAAVWDDIKDRLNKNALGLSGGQQQRLCIARALSVNPKILLMDEPTSALDPISTGKIEDLINELKNEYTIVIVTHNMQQAMRVSDKTAFFLFGEIVEYDDTEEIFSKPKNEKTEKYITGRFG
ncbi:phosphate ABC transporter ATP-binding protein PstB [uncultured Brachyspira sp.]|uniref:phosphate ABC transporter ATP-binding protein PstB n=1 Tax=uncultured Brachyspira sp. TaxID=221953 RepID=UPI00261E7632|nr:phosphate ABC transporter ATP-binding protein PstB [uncultured Brachyspira sp.]